MPRQHNLPKYRRWQLIYALDLVSATIIAISHYISRAHRFHHMNLHSRIVPSEELFPFILERVRVKLTDAEHGHFVVG